MNLYEVVTGDASQMETAALSSAGMRMLGPASRHDTTQTY